MPRPRSAVPVRLPWSRAVAAGAAAHLRRRAPSGAPSGPLHGPALLVDRDQQRRPPSRCSGALQAARRRAQLCRRREVEAVEDDAANLPEARAREQSRGRARAVHRARRASGRPAAAAPEPGRPEPPRRARQVRRPRRPPRPEYSRPGALPGGLNGGQAASTLAEPAATTLPARERGGRSESAAHSARSAPRTRARARGRRVPRADDPRARLRRRRAGLRVRARRHRALRAGDRDAGPVRGARADAGRARVAALLPADRHVRGLRAGALLRPPRLRRSIRPARSVPTGSSRASASARS